MANINIKVKDLADTQTINTDNEIMVLTNENTNFVQNITVENFITNIISSDSDNVIEQGADGKLFVESPVNITGNLSNLTTTNKLTLVGAINEVDGDVGNLADLTTSDKTNVVNAINSEVSARNTAETNIQNDYNGKIGTLSNLDTTDKSNIVGAINELAAIAEPSLQYETMNNSKALETGAPSENPIILADIQKYAHSTFDRNKFTVVGSPIITDDGIASGFSSSNYLHWDSTDLISLNEISFNIKFKTSSDITTRQEIIGGSSYNSIVPLLLRLSTDGKFYLDLHDTNGTDVAYWNVNASANTEYIMEFKISGGKFYWYVNEELAHTALDIVNPLLIFGADSRIGVSSNTTYPFLGTFNLTHYYVTSKGQTVFTGNKTDIDTIKPVNFTAVTSGADSPFINPALPFNDNGLVIRENGVASGFSNDDYISLSTSQFDYTALSTAQNWKIRFKCRYTETPETNKFSNCFGEGNTNLLVFINPHLGSIFLNLSFDGSVQASAKCTVYNLVVNTDYIIEVEFTGSEYILSVYNMDGTLFGSSNYSSTDKIYTMSHFYVCKGTDASYLVTDLNALASWINGDIVFQACLKIPYTESFTGSKIVDAIYRDRVIDAYEQGYPQRFYTLSDTDFTLPMGEIYGDIEYNRANKLDLTTANATQETVSKINGWCVPDYANGVSKVVNTVYQTAKNVYLKIVNHTDIGGGLNYVYIGTTDNPNAELVRWGGNVSTVNTIYYIIPKGYYYKVAGTAVTSIIEYPFMGE